MPLYPFCSNFAEDDEITGLSFYENSQLQRDIPVRLESVTVQATIVHIAALVEIRQKYVYTEKTNGEAAYTFPLSSGLTVTQFRVAINGRELKGVVKSNENAKKQYIKALEDHRTNLLAEDKGDKDVFRLDIGEIKPGEEITVYLNYIAEAKHEFGKQSVRFSIPKEIAPDYNYNHNGCQSNQTGNETKSKSANVTIKVIVSMEGHLAKLESPSHNVNISKIETVPGKISWTRGVVDAKAKAKDMNRDFVLVITPEEVDRPRLYTEIIGENSIAVMAHLIPMLENQEQQVELIVAVDRSNSMEGNKIRSVKIALQIFLHSIPPGSYFNIVGFGSTSEFLYPESVQYNEETLSEAIEYIKDLQPDMGGTHLNNAFQHIFTTNTIEGFLRHIFLITDDQVANVANDVAKLISANNHNTRVFSLGIGDSVSQPLIHSIAKAGNGISDFVADNEQIDHKLLDQLKIALQPSLTNIDVKWDGLESLGGKSHQAPSKLPPAFNGFPLMVYGLFSNEVPTGISINATSPDGILSIKIPIDQERDAGDLGIIRKMAALKIIRELEKSAEEKQNDFSAEKIAHQQSLKDAIIEIACENGITSKFTKYVMIDESKLNESSQGVVQQRYIPLQTNNFCKKSTCCIGHKYNLVEESPTESEDCFPGPSNKLRASGSCVHREIGITTQNTPGETDLRSLLNSCSCNPVPLRYSKSLCSKQSETMQKYMNIATFRQELDIDGFRDDLSATSASRLDLFTDFTDDDDNCDENCANPVSDLANLQSCDGYFLLTDDLCELLSIADLYSLELEATNNDWDLTAWATMLAIVHLSKLPHLKRCWELIGNKAEKWFMNNHSELWDIMRTSAQALY